MYRHGSHIYNYMHCEYDLKQRLQYYGCRTNLRETRNDNNQQGDAETSLRSFRGRVNMKEMTREINKISR